MRVSRWVGAVVAAGVASTAMVGCGGTGGGGPHDAALPPPAGPMGGAADADAGHALADVPLYFVENQGQFGDTVDYAVTIPETSVGFASTGLSYLLAPEARSEPQAEASSLDRPQARPSEPPWAIQVDFVGSTAMRPPVGDGPTGVPFSWFTGPAEEHHVGVPSFEGVRYGEIWPGIGARWDGQDRSLKSTFTVAPGADPDDIRLRYRGATSVSLRDGEVRVRTPAGGFSEQAPYAYQVVRGEKRTVASAWTLHHVADDSTVAGFRLGRYDRSLPLVIDPVTLTYSGYLGGTAGDVGFDIAVDGSGNSYVTGQTASEQASFPETVGPDLTYNGSGDAFVAKVNPAGTALVYAGYFGGTGDDVGINIVVDGSGNAYVTGTTASEQASFPETVGPDLTYNGSGDAFVAKVNPAGTALVYAGYLGGAGTDSGFGIAVDGSGNAYVAGRTTSDQASFPETVGPDLTYNGSGDAFVAKVNPAGTALLYAGYLGGAGTDFGNGIAVNGSGNAYVTGDTASDQTSFPDTVGPDLTYNGSFDDAFVAKVNPAGTALLYAGYLGGASFDFAADIAVDGTGNAYVTGQTASDQASFPETVGPDLTYNGSGDAFVAKVNPAGTALVYAGYIGGTGDDFAPGIAVDASGNAYATGRTASDQASFPETVGPDLTFNGVADAFVAKVNPAGTALLYAGYLGGTGDDVGSNIAVDGSGNAYVTGTTGSDQASFPETVGPDLTYNGGFSDAFVAKVGTGAGPTCRLTRPSANLIQVTVKDADDGLASIVVTRSTNATTTVPSFTPGTKNTVIVTSTKVNPIVASQVALRATDVLGNVTSCDLVLTTLLRGRGSSQTFAGLPAAEHLVTVTNGRPALRRITIVVNGRRFGGVLPRRASRTFDIAAALRPGDANVVRLVGHGPRGSKAEVLIWDGA